MKRKSILMTIVAVLFAGVAWGQAINWPSGLSNNVVGSDTIYFCVSSDSLYPIEFGYDVAGMQLHPSWGDWQLISKTEGMDVADIADYKFDADKNEGAGNAYKTVGSGIGGVLFEYTSKSDQCGLSDGKKFWIYVFILPQKDKVVTPVPVDTFFCLQPTASTRPKGEIEFQKIFKKYVAVYNATGFEYVWKSSDDETPTKVYILLDSIAQYSLRDTLVIKSYKDYGDGYTCGDAIPFLFKVKVDSIIRDTIGKARTICAFDTVDALGNRTPATVFQRSNLPSGKYYSDENKTKELTNIKGWSSGENTAKKKLFYYYYNDCNGDTHKIVDTLKVIDDLGSNADVGIDTVNYCRIPGTVSVLDLYDLAWYPHQPVLNPSGSDSYWTDKGITNLDPTSGDYPSKLVYGTIDGSTSSLLGHDLNLDNMKSSIGYFYLWNVDNSVHTCFVDNTGKPGNGTLVVILQDPIVAQDYTAQLCKKSYSASVKFDLNVYTGLNVAWTSADTTVTDAQIEPNALLKSTYKFKYNVPAICGAGGKGVLYVKVADHVKAPVTKTVKFCKDKLPTSINLNDILGVQVNGLQWEVTGASHAPNANAFKDGIFYPGYYFNNSSTDTKLTFQLTSASSSGELCGLSSSTKVILDFTL